MNNFEAYAFIYENNTDSLSSLTRKFNYQSTVKVKDEYFLLYRLKFVGLLKREKFRERDKNLRLGMLKSLVHLLNKF